MEPVTDKHVLQFRQILLWPLQLMPLRAGSQIQQHWEALEQPGPDNPWREVADEFTGDVTEFQERHYNEFVTFLPYVQRFLYGESRTRRGGADADYACASPMRVFRRTDVAAVRVVARTGAPALTLKIAHIDLYFFYDIDVVLLNVEVVGENLPLAVVQDTLYRFGRAYPAGWDESGQGLHCMHRVDWLDAAGQVLAVSDSQRRERFLSFVCQHRATRISAHWEWLLRPLALDHSDAQGAIRYRQLEYYRMPTMAYLAVADPAALTRNDYIRLGLVTSASSDEAAPFASGHMADFEEQYCYDRFWCDSGPAPNTRYLCCGHALVVVGDAKSAFFTHAESGVLAQFRHQHFLLFLIAHFQKAALLMFSDRLVDALNRLDIADPSSVRRFKRAIRQLFEIFLRFTHRYWFHEVSEQAQAKALFHMCSKHLTLDTLYAEVRERIHDMSQYLDTDSLRRQAQTVVRLTVVTAFGLVGTVTTGFLGMNLIAEADAPTSSKMLWFAVVLVLTTALTFYSIAKSKRLSDFLDALSDENLPARAKIGALLAVWARRKD
jgi:hypothetical protein